MSHCNVVVYLIHTQLQSANRTNPTVSVKAYRLLLRMQQLCPHGSSIVGYITTAIMHVLSTHRSLSYFAHRLRTAVKERTVHNMCQLADSGMLLSHGEQSL